MYEMNNKQRSSTGLKNTLLSLLTGFVVSTVMLSATALADETCQSPYMAKIVGQEDYVMSGPWVWWVWEMSRISWSQ